jgi:glycosyltransferase involved in cell wall biosynthesis
LDQSFQDFEIIISDDNSQDNSIEEIEKFNDPRIKLIKNNINRGPSNNLNIAIKNASSDLVTLIGSDDKMNNSRLKESYQFIKENNFDVIFSYIETIDSEDNIIEHPILNLCNRSMNRIEMLRYFFFNGNFAPAVTVVIKKDIFEKIGYFNPSLIQLQDFEMWIRILVNNYKIGFLEEKLTFYRIHDKNLSSGSENESEFLSRCYIENSIIFKNFLSLNADDFKEVFKKELEKFKLINPEYIPFYIGSIAFDHFNNLSLNNQIQSWMFFYNNFAINTIFDFSINVNLSEDLQNDLEIKFQDFYNIFGSNELMKHYILSKKHNNDLINQNNDLIIQNNDLANQNNDLVNKNKILKNNFRKKLKKFLKKIIKF